MKNPSNPKLEIFVGSTRKDLAKVRQAVINAILEKGHIPSGMELWAAGNSPPRERIAEHLDRCDAHILILGARYGSSTGSADSESFTEWEFRQSDGKRPVLPFLLDDTSLQAARKLETDPWERDANTRKKLDTLRAELKRERFVREFTLKNIGDLQKDAILAIDQLIHSRELRETAGWIRGDSDEAKIVRDVVSNRFLKRELEQLQKFSKLGKRVSHAVGAKEAMAGLFWAHMQGRIRRNGYHQLFFESGSTMAYLAEQFERAVLAADEGEHDWQIRTNNVLLAVQFDLHTPIDASRFPPGVPDPADPYGAIFPNEWRRLHEPPPNLPRNLFKEEKTAVERMRRNFAGAKISASDRPKLQLVLAAASGLDLDNFHVGFRGPHVASHPNMLFKRAIFTSGCPVVLFINAEKLGDPFKPGKCYPVFDAEQPWQQVVRDYPLAICVGYGQKGRIQGKSSPAAIDATLRKLGFNIEYFSGLFESPAQQDDIKTGAIMIGNRKFAERIPKDWA